MDVHFDGVGADGGIPVVELLLELSAREYDAGAVRKRNEQGVFLGGEQHGLSVKENLARFGADQQLAALDRGFAAARGAAQQRADARRELVEVIGLHQIVVCARVKPLNAILHRVAGRGDKHRQVHLLGARLAQNRQAVLARQPEIENHQRKGSRAQRDDGRVAVLNPVDGISFGLQSVDDAVANHLIVFNKQNTHGKSLAWQNSQAAGADAGIGKHSQMIRHSGPRKIASASRL